MEGRPAGDEHLQIGTWREKLSNKGSSGEQMLEIVQHEQNLSTDQVLPHALDERGVPCLTQSERPANCCQHHRGRIDGCEIDKPDAFVECAYAPAANGDREPALPDASRTSDSEEANIVTLQQFHSARDGLVTTNQRSRLDRQIVTRRTHEFHHHAMDRERSTFAPPRRQQRRSWNPNRATVAGVVFGPTALVATFARHGLLTRCTHDVSQPAAPRIPPDRRALATASFHDRA